MAEEIENKAEGKHENVERTFKWIGYLLLFFGLVLTLIIGYSSERFSIGWIIVVLAILGTVSGILIFFFKLKEKISVLKNKTEEASKIPEPASVKYIKDKLKFEAFKNRDGNEVKEIVKQREDRRGEMVSYIFDIETLYKNNKGNNQYTVIYSLNYPERDPTILPSPSPAEIKSALNSINLIKDVPMKEKHQIIKDPFRGTEVEQHEKGPAEKQKEENKKKREGKVE